jgi:hypothetical protein
MPKVNSYVLIVAVLTLVFCSMEMVPGWGIFKLNWDRATFYLIVATTGALAGSISAKRRLLGMAAGALAMMGALFCTALVLDHVQSVPKVVLVLAGGIGALPGVGFYFCVDRLLNKLRNPTEDLLHGVEKVEQVD